MNCCILTDRIADYIDDLLVANGFEKPRQIKNSTYVPYYSGIGVQEKPKERARVKVILNFNVNCAFFRYKHYECYYNLESNKMISHKDLRSSRKLAPFVLQAIQKHHEEIKEERESYKELKNYKTIRYGNRDDNNSGVFNNSNEFGFPFVTNTREYKDMFPNDIVFDVYGTDKIR